MAVTQTKLKNGVTVVSDSMPHLQSASIYVCVGAGARYERREENGISHLLEHMAFKGTKRRSARAIAEEIEAVGGEINAATSTEDTNYFAHVLAQDVPLAFDLLSDILCHSTFCHDELKREKHVILQEIGAAHDSPEDELFDRFLQSAWKDQAIGRPILGKAEIVSRLNRDDLLKFMDDHYRGPNIIICAVGRVEHDEIVRLAENGFSAIPADMPAKPETAHYTGGESRLVRDLMECHLVLGFEGCSFNNEDYYTAQILASALGGGMSSRLFQELRENKGLCYTVGAFHWPFYDTGLFGIHSVTSLDDFAELAEILRSELNLLGEGLDAKELARTKAQARAGLLMTLESPSARAAQIVGQVRKFGRVMEFDEIIAFIDKVDSTKSSEIASKLFLGGSPTISVISGQAEIKGLEILSGAAAENFSSVHA